ncbi:ABC transporter ATP-binding protein [Mangrovicoccus sp. HB161399]|uniref:ABC transporter ATP-binding protein n=1 Tax=Mangrovicoccus sp. HB161399 TaxID=2720392 RepID=UPI0020A64022|nr:ABC transporter ATP-binding protein [Mangrovicoccus sp. HB161399]
MSPHVLIDGIAKSYGGAPALRGATIEIGEGEFAALLGPSGCGKSTLLRILSGLLEPDRGRILLGGEDITRLPAWDRDIGLVFQNYALFPHMTVAQNVGFGLEMRRLSRGETRTRVVDALAAVGLAGLDRRRPSELSGGQQQRVAIARAIAIRPRLLLLDEPLSNLDAVLRSSVRSELRELHDRTGITTVMVTHDQSEALSIADRVILMKDGSVVQAGTPKEIYGRPATAFAASFVGNPPAALFPLPSAAAAGAAGWQPPPLLRDAIRRGGVTMALRPEDLVLGAGPACLPAKLRRIEFQGADQLALAEAFGQPLAVRLGRGETVAGPQIRIALPERPLLYDTATGDPVAIEQLAEEEQP